MTHIHTDLSIGYLSIASMSFDQSLPITQLHDKSAMKKASHDWIIWGRAFAGVESVVIFFSLTVKVSFKLEVCNKRGTWHLSPSRILCPGTYHSLKGEFLGDTWLQAFVKMAESRKLCPAWKSRQTRSSTGHMGDRDTCSLAGHTCR